MRDRWKIRPWDLLVLLALHGFQSHNIELVLIYEKHCLVVIANNSFTQREGSWWSRGSALVQQRVLVPHHSSDPGSIRSLGAAYVDCSPALIVMNLWFNYKSSLQCSSLSCNLYRKCMFLWVVLFYRSEYWTRTWRVWTCPMLMAAHRCS